PRRLAPSSRPPRSATPRGGERRGTAAAGIRPLRRRAGAVLRGTLSGMPFSSPALPLEWNRFPDTRGDGPLGYDMAANWIVRHGAMRFLGEFDPGDGAYARGHQ